MGTHTGSHRFRLCNYWGGPARGLADPQQAGEQYQREGGANRHAADNHRGQATIELGARPGHQHKRQHTEYAG